MSRAAEFITDFHAEDIAEGKETRRLRMLEPLRVWSAVLQDEIVVPAGFEFDGESIPSALHWLVPPFGQSKRGAAVHDYLYRNHGYIRTGSFVSVTRQQADAVYKELVTAKGLPPWRATMRHAVLRLVGWKAWLALLVLALPSCEQDIVGLSRNERLTIYGTALTLSGKPELGAVAYGLRRSVTNGKNPTEILP